MFTNYESDVVGFESNWKSEIKMMENGSQTTEFTTSDKETITNISHSISVQTETESKTDLQPRDNESLDRWLKEIAPKVIDELSSSKYTMFSRYETYGESESQTVRANLIQSIKPEKQDPILSKQNESSSLVDYSTSRSNIPIIDLSWSSAGNTLVAATGYLYHEDWCQHNGAINVYSKRGKNDDLVFVHNIKLSSCASSIKFHPSEPALLAAATFSGEIHIFNLQYLEDTFNRDLLVSLNSTSHFGRQISTLTWMTSEQAIKYFPDLSNSSSVKILVSSASDGQINIWIYDVTSLSLTLKITYKLKCRKEDKAKQAPDISCTGFTAIWDQSDDIKNARFAATRECADDYFVVGTRTGELLLCKTLGLKTSMSKILDPYIENLESHDASILSIKFSTLKQRLFLTLGADQELRVYNILVDSPIHIIVLQGEYSTADWVPNSDSLILLAMSRGSKKSDSSLLQVFSADTKIEIPLEGLEKGTEFNAGVTAIALNKSISNKIAYGDMQGRIKIWSIPFKDITGYTSHRI